jgi:hypothetical protein
VARIGDAAAGRAAPGSGTDAPAAPGSSTRAERSAPEAEAPRRQRILAAPPPSEPQAPPGPVARDAIEGDPRREDTLRRPVEPFARQGSGTAAPESPAAKVAAPRGAPSPAKLTTLEPAARVSGRLGAREPAAAERHVGALAVDLGGRLLTRRAEGDDVVLEVTLPRARWAELAQGLATLGTWQADSPAPDTAPTLLVVIRLTR